MCWPRQLPRGQNRLHSGGEGVAGVGKTLLADRPNCALGVSLEKHPQSTTWPVGTECFRNAEHTSGTTMEPILAPGQLARSAHLHESNFAKRNCFHENVLTSPTAPGPKSAPQWWRKGCPAWQKHSAPIGQIVSWRGFSNDTPKAIFGRSARSVSPTPGTPLPPLWSRLWYRASWRGQHIYMRAILLRTIALR